MQAMRFFHDLRIRYKLFTAYAIAFILTVSLGGGIIYVSFEKTIENRIENELLNTTTAIINMMRTTFSISVRHHLKTIAEKNLEIVDHLYAQSRKNVMTEEHAKQMAEEILLSQSIGTTGYIYCLARDGKIRVHPENSLLGTDLSDYDFIKQQKKQKNGYIEYDWKNPGEKSLRPKALYMVYFEPWDWIISVSSYRDEFRNLIDINDFKESIGSLQFSRKGFSMIFDRSGNVIVEPREHKQFFDPADAAYASFVKLLVKNKNGKKVVRYKDSKGKAGDVMVIFSEIPNLNWIAACFIDLEDAYSPLGTIRLAVGFTVILSLFLFLPLTLWLSASITRPLNILIKHLDTSTPDNILAPIEPPSRDEVGRLITYFNVFMKRLEYSGIKLSAEIEERRKAENAIRESEKKYRTLVQNANSIILQVNEKGYISFMNSYALTFFGYEKKEILGRHLRDTIISKNAPTDRNFSAAVEWEDKKSDISTNPVFENVKKDGERVWVSWSRRTLYDKNGNVSEFLFIGNDITQRVKMEEVMLQSEKMISIGGLAAGMAHEINNPLGVMVQNTQNIIRRFSSALDINALAAEACGVDFDNILKYVRAREIDVLLEDILQSGLRVSAIVVDMLNFSRPGEDAKTWVDIADLIEKTIQIAARDYNLKKKYDFRRIDIVREIEKNIAEVRVIGTEIQQVVLNLLRNAAQAMGVEGAIYKKYRIVIRVYRKNGSLHIEVEDNGPGMDKERKSRIFEPFFTTKPVGVGTGLGLSVSYFIITTRHNGRFTVDSSPGMGSRFLIEIPIENQEGQESN